ncbi:MAG: putative quinol monooxygenase [Bacteroidales bacterium]
MIAIAWHFDVKQGHEPRFEQLVGADGPWHALARRSRSFLGSSFLRDAVQPTRYLLVEYWSEMLVYERHQADFVDEIRQLEAERDALVDTMTPTGIFTALNVPDRAGPTWSTRRG